MAKSENDFQVGNQTMSTEVASVTTRDIQVLESVNNDLYMRIDVPEAYRIDAKPYIERPFYVGEVAFTTSAGRYTLLQTPIQFMPGDIARSNTSVLNMFKLAAYGRPNLMLNISMAGTITHAGCLLVGVLPPMPAYPTVNTPQQNLLNTIMSGPHGFLNANEATSIALPVPWFCNTDMATLDMEQTGSYVTTLDITQTNGNYATLVFMVLNPLRPSTGSSTTLNIVIEACFKAFDLVVPTPRFVKWQSQAGVRAQCNPCYDEYQGELQEVIEEHTGSYTQMLQQCKFLAAVALTFLTKLAAMYLPLPPPRFHPQMGLVDVGKNIVSGLFDKAAGGLKEITSDAIDVGRGLVRDWTGLHNPNVPLIEQRVITSSVNYCNVVDSQQYFEKLDPNATFDRVVKEPVFGTSVDEMALSHITGKEQYIGSFVVKTTDPVGTLKWIKPISPFQGGMADLEGKVKCANNLELLHSLHRAWRGGLKIKIQSVMNNKQQVKLKVLKYYNPSVQATINVPEYKSIANAPSHLLEFTGGGQTQVVDLPFLCRNELCPTAEYMEVEPLFHGLYYIYVAQPLVVSDGSPTDVEFNVYMSGDPDLTFYGYAKTNTYHENFKIIPQVREKNKAIDQFSSMPFQTPDQYIAMTDEDRYVPALRDTDKHWKNFLVVAKVTEPIAAFKLNQDRIHALAQRFGVRPSDLVKPINIKYMEPFATHFRHPSLRGPLRSEDWVAQSGSVQVMNEPQEQETNLHRDDKVPNIGYYTRLIPNVDVRPLVRRMYKTATQQLEVDRNSDINVGYPLAAYLGEDPKYWNYTPIETISRMYYGKTVGFKVRVSINLVAGNDSLIDDVTDLSVRVYYSPQNLSYNGPSKSITAPGINYNSYVNPTLASSVGEIPMPFQLTPRTANKIQAIYEFVIPDTSFYKFMGGPDKFRDFDSNYAGETLSTADFGTFILQFANLREDKPARFTLETFVGLTDESRLGFHSIAPVFSVNKTYAYYLGDSSNATNPIPSSLNPNLYKGGYL